MCGCQILKSAKMLFSNNTNKKDRTSMAWQPYFMCFAEMSTLNINFNVSGINMRGERNEQSDLDLGAELGDVGTANPVDAVL